ncbi:MAG: hypothetical protein JXB49_01375 [Bacteroidales bacterium]|nr:hypothetical protein [Bacteroidales bacterium]
MSKREVFNNLIGNPYVFQYPKLTREQEREIIAVLFEQLLLFDKITISTSKNNFGLFLLIKELGLNIVEKLLDYGYIRFLLWTPVIMTSEKKTKDNRINEDIKNDKMPPVFAGELSSKDFDPERSIENAISHFRIQRDRKRILTRIALKNIIVPDGMEFSKDSAKFIISAYQNNDLCNLGLPYLKEPHELNLEERMQLLNLGHKILETAVLSRYELKSYENYEHYEICKQSLSNIGKAYNISENTNVLFKLENLPDLKELFLKENINFDNVFALRNLSSAKYYRKWINETGENCNAQEITKEYLNEIKGNNNFFDSTKGKFIKSLGLFTINTGIGAAMAGPLGTMVGFGLGLLESLYLDNILKGKNPSMFINDIRNRIG